MASKGWWDEDRLLFKASVVADVLGVVDWTDGLTFRCPVSARCGGLTSDGHHLTIEVWLDIHDDVPPEYRWACEITMAGTHRDPGGRVFMGNSSTPEDALVAAVAEMREREGQEGER